MTADELWAIARPELNRNLPGVAVSYLTGSRMEEGDPVDGIPVYRIIVEARAAAGLSWLTVQAGPAIRRKLSSLLGKSVLVEITSESEEAS